MRVKHILGKLFKGSGWAVFTMFVWELVEEGLEQLIAVAISGAVTMFVTKALSTLAIITATQGIKLTIKRSLMPFIKTFTYKKGNDKMNLIKKFFTFIYANKKTIMGTISAGVAVVCGSGLVDIGSLDSIMIGGVNITPIIFYVCLGVLILIGVFGKGFESIKTFFDRIKTTKESKEQNRILKLAAKELKVEQKEQTIGSKEETKTNKRELIKAQKEQAKAQRLAEIRARIEEAKEKLKLESTTNE